MVSGFYPPTPRIYWVVRQDDGRYAVVRNRKTYETGPLLVCEKESHKNIMHGKDARRLAELKNGIERDRHVLRSNTN